MLEPILDSIKPETSSFIHQASSFYSGYAVSATKVSALSETVAWNSCHLRETTETGFPLISEELRGVTTDGMELGGMNRNKRWILGLNDMRLLMAVEAER